MKKETNIRSVVAAIAIMITMNVCAQEKKYNEQYYKQFNKARALLSNQKWTRGEVIINKLLHQYPKEPDLLATRGRLKMAFDDLKGAKIALKRALILDPGNTIATLGMAEVKNLEGEYGEALSLAQEAFDKNTEVHLFEPIVNLKSRLLVRTENYGEAEQVLSRTLNSQIKKPSLINDLAYVYQRQQSPEKALGVLLEGLDEFADDPATLNNIGYILNGMEKPEEAMHYLKTSLKIAPENPVVHSNLAISYYLLDDLDKARDCAMMAIKLDLSECPQANVIMSRIFHDMGDEKEASKICTEGSESQEQYELASQLKLFR